MNRVSLCFGCSLGNQPSFFCNPLSSEIPSTWIVRHNTHSSLLLATSFRAMETPLKLGTNGVQSIISYFSCLCLQLFSREINLTSKTVEKERANSCWNEDSFFKTAHTMQQSLKCSWNGKHPLWLWGYPTCIQKRRKKHHTIEHICTILAAPHDPIQDTNAWRFFLFRDFQGSSLGSELPPILWKGCLTPSLGPRANSRLRASRWLEQQQAFLEGGESESVRGGKRDEREKQGPMVGVSVTFGAETQFRQAASTQQRFLRAGWDQAARRTDGRRANGLLFVVLPSGRLDRARTLLRGGWLAVVQTSRGFGWASRYFRPGDSSTFVHLPRPVRVPLST